MKFIIFFFFSFLGLGNYKIQYLDNGLTDFKNGAALRKALPLIN